jgi:crossover junction endodeoxyribonuclease RuvC
MIILGIDPGTASTGYGIIKKIQKSKFKTQKKLKCLGYGVIETTPALTTPERLKKLNNELSKLIKKHRPAVLVVENIYFFKNLKTVMPVSQAEGVILLTAAKNNTPVFELSPLQAKMAITGYGRAEKIQVQKKIKTLLNLKELPRPDDAADALAIALAYCLQKKKI